MGTKGKNVKKPKQAKEAKEPAGKTIITKAPVRK